MTKYSIGERVVQVEAARLLKGQGRFTDDVTLGRQAYVVFLRSPHAHADIVRIDTRRAVDMPGVLAVLTGEDYAADGLGDVFGVSPLKKRDGSPMFRPPRPAIRNDRVRHVGQIVAMVVAESVNQAKDAAEAIEVEYRPLPAVASIESARKPGAPAIWNECPDNEPFFHEIGDDKAVSDVLANAPHVVRETFPVTRLTANTMEPRAVVADYDRGRDQYTIYAGQQRPFVWRTMMTRHLFRIPEQQMVIIAGDVGGSFGMKGPLYCEPPLLAWAAKRVGRPVKWTCERSEAYLADDQGRDMTFDFELGLDKNGKFMGARMSAKTCMGAYLTMNAPVASMALGHQIVGMYATPNLHTRAAGTFANTVPISNYRAPACPAVYALERMVDMAAKRLNLDPAEIRRRNLISPAAMPYKNKFVSYDCGDFAATLERCLVLADYAGAATRRKEAAARGKVRGVGMSTTVDPVAGPGPETAEIRFDPGGDITVVVGSTAGGQSHATVYTQIVSEKLGVDVERIQVIEGQTDKLAWGTGTGASRTATIGGNAVALACTKIVDKAKRIAAHLLEASEADLEFKDGAFRVAGTDRTLPFAEVAKAAFDPTKLGQQVESGLYENATWSSRGSNVPYAAHICEVELDPETGVITLAKYFEVHDVGVELNPTLVAGQIHGGIAQAVGEVLIERIVYGDDGQLLTGSFLDYPMPRADDFCNFTVESRPVPTKTNALGVKGAGEVGTTGAIAAAANAVADALAEFGVMNFTMPATPARVWEAIHAQKR